jgi:hypothetical protein
MSDTNLQSRLETRLKRPLPHSLLVALFYSFLFVVFFSPSLLQGAPLAVGADGQNLYLPNFLGRKVFWDNMIFAGFPMMADPQVMTWYPLALLLSLIPGSWNLFILLAYVLTASFMYGYILTITESKLAALTSGTILGLSGFMMAHLGHAVVIHSVAWMPLLLWSYEKLRRHWSPGWFVAGSSAIALSFLGGHTPIFTLGFGLATTYAIVLGWSAPIGRWRYYLTCALLIVLGIGLVAIQIVPTAEIAGESIRVGYKFSDFISHSLPPHQVLMLVFPKLFGGLKESGALPYYGAENLTELTGYVGLLPLLLAGIGVAKWPQRTLSIFWLCVALIAVVLAMGDATPLARLIYHVPVVNQFRAPGRHLLEFTIAICVLASLGIATLLRKQETSSLVFKTIAIGSLLLIASAVITFTNLEKLIGLAAHKDLPAEQVWRWTRWAVGIPLALLIASAVSLWFWARLPKSFARIGALLLVLVVDLAGFGWSYDWRYAAINKEALHPPEIAVRYHRLLADGQRVLPSRGTMAPVGEIPPNLSRLWAIPNASGYNSLILSRFSRLLNMQDVGSVTRPLWLDSRDQSLNLAAVRYLFIPSYQLTTDERGISWQKDDMQLVLGADCVEHSRDSVTFKFPSQIKTSAIAIVARLACASQIPEGAKVVEIRVTDNAGEVETHSFLAGRDASEWAFDCNQVKPYMKHQRAQVFTTSPIKMNDESCVVHSYVSTLKLRNTEAVSSIELKWVGGFGSMLLDKVSMMDENAQTSQPVDPLTIGDRWRFLEETNGSRVYENNDAQPRAWLVSEVAVVQAEQALTTSKTSKLPDGREFEPKQLALIEEPLKQALAGSDLHATAEIGSLTDNVMEVRTSSATPAFLVTSDVYYPGWQASIDGQLTDLYRADYAFRGVLVPAGQHVVRFSYRSRHFYLGVAVSVASLLILVSGLWLCVLKRRQDSD